MNNVNRSTSNEFDLDSGFNQLIVKATLLRSRRRAYDKMFINRASKRSFVDNGDKFMTFSVALASLVREESNFPMFQQNILFASW